MAEHFITIARSIYINFQKSNTIYSWFGRREYETVLPESMSLRTPRTDGLIIKPTTVSSSQQQWVQGRSLFLSVLPRSKYGWSNSHIRTPHLNLWTTLKMKISHVITLSLLMSRPGNIVCFFNKSATLNLKKFPIIMSGSIFPPML